MINNIAQWLRPLLFALILFVAACGKSKDGIENSILEARSTEDVSVYVNEAGKMRDKGIPILTNVIRKSLPMQHNLISYHRVNASLLKLRELALQGVVSDDEPFELLEIMKEQKFVTDMTLTSEIVTIITNTDIGLNKEYFESYSIENEDDRLELIENWSDLLRKTPQFQNH